MSGFPLKPFKGFFFVPPKSPIENGFISCFHVSVAPVLLQIELRSQDQALIRQLMDLHAGIQELKQECGVDDEQLDQLEEFEEHSWDSDSDTEGSGTSSYSGGMSFSSAIYSNIYTSPLACSLPKRTSGRRSSVP